MTHEFLRKNAKLDMVSNLPNDVVILLYVLGEDIYKVTITADGKTVELYRQE